MLSFYYTILYHCIISGILVGPFSQNDTMIQNRVIEGVNYLARVSKEQRMKMREMYESGQFTRSELAAIFHYSVPTINRALGDAKKKFKYDAMAIAIPFSALSREPVGPENYKYDPYTMIDKQPEFSKVVKCPSCNYRCTVNKLLMHLINKHHRFDLEYLINDV